MASRPVLNNDILLEVAAASSWKNATSLLNTCRFLNIEGPKALLRQSIDLDTPATLLRFLASLRRALDDTRYSSVRSLHFTLEVSRMKKKAFLELISALPLMCNLSSLYMSDSEYLFDDRFGLRGPFAALTSLRELYLPAASKITVKFLQSSQSSLVSVNVSFPPENDEDGFFDEYVTQEHDWPKYHPAVLLVRSRSTLRELECERWYTHSEITPDPGLVYPKM